MQINSLKCRVRRGFWDSLQNVLYHKLLSVKLQLSSSNFFNFFNYPKGVNAKIKKKKKNQSISFLTLFWHKQKKLLTFNYFQSQNEKTASPSPSPEKDSEMGINVGLKLQTLLMID